MPIKIYKTFDMEGAIHTMVRRNDLAIVFMAHWCRRRIPLIEEKVINIPSITIEPRLEGWRYILERWHRRHCLLYYKYKPYPDWRPRADAMLFVETPLSYNFFEWIIRGISREIIVYCPPDWSMQEETLEIKAPGTDEYRTVLEIARAFRLNIHNSREELALKLSGYPPNATSVFSLVDISTVCGLHPATIKKIVLKGVGKQFRCYFLPIRLNHPPSDDQLSNSYKRLVKFEDRGEGLRMIKSANCGISLPTIHRLVECGAVTTYPLIFVLTEDWKPLDVSRLDIEHNAKMADWYKMRQLIDGSEEYENII